MLKGAIVGFGEVARHGHWPAYAASDALTDRRRRRAQRRAARDGRESHAGASRLRHARRDGRLGNRRFHRHLHAAGAPWRADARRPRAWLARRLRKAVPARRGRPGAGESARRRAGRGGCAGAQLEVRADRARGDGPPSPGRYRPASAGGDRDRAAPRFQGRRSRSLRTGGAIRRSPAAASSWITAGTRCISRWTGSGRTCGALTPRSIDPGPEAVEDEAQRAADVRRRRGVDRADVERHGAAELDAAGGRLAAR